MVKMIGSVHFLMSSEPYQFTSLDEIQTMSSVILMRDNIWARMRFSCENFAPSASVEVCREITLFIRRMNREFCANFCLRRNSKTVANFSFHEREAAKSEIVNSLVCDNNYCKGDLNQDKQQTRLEPISKLNPYGSLWNIKLNPDQF